MIGSRATSDVLMEGTVSSPAPEAVERGVEIPATSVRGHPKFLALLDEMRATHVAKGTDYSNPADILANLRGCESLGLPAWLGVMVRIGDKFARIVNLARKKWLGAGGPAVKDESIRDTLVDMASYALLAIILMEEEKS